MSKQLEYLSGFAGLFQTEAVPGSLPMKQNSPQKAPHGLYAELISGTAFTAPRVENQRSWQYRIRPSVCHSSESELIEDSGWLSPDSTIATPPTQLRWSPLPYPKDKVDFVASINTLLANGDIDGNAGGAVHLYAANKDMTDHYFYNADGELLIIPQEGGLLIFTEMGKLAVAPSEIAVIPRGIRFQVSLPDGKARGYICENYGAPFVIPDKGVIGRSGLADERHFQSPVACYEERSGQFQLTTKFSGKLWTGTIPHSPLDVVAWHGNYAPYKYDLTLFNPLWSVGWDHTDPSIFTVLTSPSLKPGTANMDFVIFPSRWMVVEDTFRPPYFHRNVMSEFMGLIHGEYDGKKDGFAPGGGSLHNCMSAHGPDAKVFEEASNQALTPHYYESTLAFMLESSKVWQVTKQAYEQQTRQRDYLDCWKDLKNHFKK